MNYTITNMTSTCYLLLLFLVLLPPLVCRVAFLSPIPLRTGLVITDISRDMGWFLRVGHEVFKPILNLFLKQPKAGAFTRYAYCTNPLLFTKFRCCLFVSRRKFSAE